jgi:hypothetical protein
MNDTCPKCHLPIYSNIKDVEFVAGRSPVVTMTIRVQAYWCPRPDCFKRVTVYNYIDESRSNFVDEVMRVRDLIRPIADGLIGRSRRVSTYDDKPGMRKTTIKDSRGIATRAIERLNKAINNFTALDWKLL